MKKNYLVMCTTFFEVITQCCGNQKKEVKLYQFLQVKFDKSDSITINLSSFNSTRKDFQLSKVVEIFFLGWSIVQTYFCSSSRLGSLTPKQAVFEVVKHPPVASEMSEGRILNNKQLQNNEQLLNTIQRLFYEYFTRAPDLITLSNERLVCQCTVRTKRSLDRKIKLGDLANYWRYNALFQGSDTFLDGQPGGVSKIKIR